MIQLTRKNIFQKFNFFHKFQNYLTLIFIIFRDYLVEKVLIHSLFWIEQLVFDFISARYAILRTFCIGIHKEEISLRKFISSGVFVKIFVRLTNRLFLNRKY